MGSFQGKFGVFATMNTMLFFLLGLTSRNHALPPIIEQNHPFIGVDNQLFDFIILTPLLISQITSLLPIQTLPFWCLKAPSTMKFMM